MQMAFLVLLFLLLVAMIPILGIVQFLRQPAKVRNVVPVPRHREKKWLLPGQKVWYRSKAGNLLRAEVLRPDGNGGYYIRRHRHPRAAAFRRKGEELELHL
ncbi:hypothetical protein D6779_10355 [Candidatus Parcubacteria bacterium]|nr:MAG: hypothetical protein D6779_10355 [Candidatus Parcubacteria bacterium]